MVNLGLGEEIIIPKSEGWRVAPSLPLPPILRLAGRLVWVTETSGLGWQVLGGLAH